MSWIQTYKGNRFFPLYPYDSYIDIEDIAHALSNICRFAGHSKHFYSVAEHSVLVSRNLPEGFKLWGLLHDAAEAYMSDIPKPIKNQLPDYVELEENILEVIANRFGLSFPIPYEVKEIDNRILIDEKNQLMNECKYDWGLQNDPLDIKLKLWKPEEAKKQFLREFKNIILGD